MSKVNICLIISIISIFFITGASQTEKTIKSEKEFTVMKEYDAKYEQATLGGGCFWCVEAVFESLDGIIDVVSGYADGKTENPNYEEVSSGITGHAEVTRIVYDPAVITFKDILKLFFKAHDPTTLNRQGADVGTQYRSIVLYHNESQKNDTLKYIKKLEAEKQYDSPIVTQVTEMGIFYPAEEYHQDYFQRNPDQAYCAYVIAPKLKKLGSFIDGMNEK